MRVLLVIEATIGGTRRHIVDLARGLHRRGNEVWLASAMRRDPGYPADVAALAAEGVRCVEVPMVRSIRPLRDLLDLRRLVALMRAVRPDVVHTHSSKAGVLGRLAAFEVAVPAVVHTPHTFAFLFRSEFGAGKRALFRALETQLGSATGAVVAVSESEARTARASGVVPPERVRVVPNGIDARRWVEARPAPREALGVPPAAPLLAVLGLLTVAKGQDLALAALARAELADAHLLIAGPGEKRAELEALARRLGVERRAHFLGWRDDAPALVAASDVVLLPSRWEGMPYIVLESMAAGRPVVATRVDGARELVVDGVTGALVELEDAAGLARATAGILGLPREARERMAAAARERVLGRFTTDRMVAGLLAVYRELPVRILHVVTTLDVGGAEMHLLAQVRGQCSRGHAVRVAYLKGQGRLAEDFRAAGAERVVPIGASPAALLRLWPHLRWCEIVHSHLLKADALTAVAATLAGRRGGLVSGKHNDEQVLRRRTVALVHGLLGRLPRATIVLSDHVGRFVERHGRIPRSRQTRIYYGLDPLPFEAAAARPAQEREAWRRSLGLAPEPCVFVCVARFAPQKAHDVLLAAFARALELWRRGAGGAEPRLLLLGDDPFGDGLERARQQARQLGIEAEVVFAGIRRDVAQALAASDVFVLASLWEGLGLVFLEAMAAGLPVLATDVSAVPEVVERDVTGLLVPPGDPQALALGMLRLASEPALRARLGTAGRERVRANFGLDRMVQQTLEVYAGLLGGDRRQTRAPSAR